MKLLLLPLLGLLLGAQEAKKPDPPDRSGEPALKRIMEDMSKLRNVRVTINTGSRDRKGALMEADQVITLWLAGGNRAAIVYGSMWGDGGRFVSDGKTVLIDPLDDTQLIQIKEAKPSLYEADEEWERKGDPFLYLLAGPKAIEKVAGKDTAIVELAADGSERAVQYKSAKKGTVKLFYQEKNGQRLVSRVEYDNRPWLEEQVKLFPEWYDSPQEPLTQLLISYEFGIDFPRGTIDTRPPKGKAVNDQRKKPAKKPPLVSSALAGL